MYSIDCLKTEKEKAEIGKKKFKKEKYNKRTEETLIKPSLELLAILSSRFCTLKITLNGKKFTAFSHFIIQNH